MPPTPQPTEERRLWTDTLAEMIGSGETERGKKVSRLGFFCEPYRPPSGIFADTVIKVYRTAAGADLERLVRAHDAYIAFLRDSGVQVPETRILLVPVGGREIPVIVQEALPAETMMRARMVGTPLPEAMSAMQAAGEVIARFWAYAAGREERVGFHPSIRNLAIIDGVGVFFDSFPPLIDYSHAEMGQALASFSSNRWLRAVAPFMRKRIEGIQDEWYDPMDNLVGLVGSACRLRPDDSARFLDWGRSFAAERMGMSPEIIAAELAEPPKLPGYWRAVRTLIGKTGTPDQR